MQQIDSTALATALPSMAVSLGVPPLRLHSAITIYLLALGVFLPVSGWIADRFGPRKVFCAALAIFSLASLVCAAADGLAELILARIVQGFGGAMMLPVARLIVVRSVSRSDLVSAMVLMSMPTVVGPALGPLLGGFLTEAVSWRWIFWINLPVAAIGIVLALLFIPEIPPGERKPFDIVGFSLSGLGIGAIIFGLDSASRGPGWQALALAAGGLLALMAFARHARRASNPILDLRVFRHQTFRASVFGGTLFRLGVGALPFMLPLLLQEVFGYSPFQSGAVTFASAVGAFGMRTITKRILHRFGFRKVLAANALISGFSIALCAAFTSSTAPLVMVAVVFFGGLVRALEFTSINTIAFADVREEMMSHATTLSQMAQRIAQSVGIAFAATLLHGFAGGAAQLTNGAFSLAFLTIAFVSALSFFSFYLLPPTAGDLLAGRGPEGQGEPA